jgi:DNA gyrase subunit A
VVPDQSDEDVQARLRSIDEQLLILAAIEAALAHRHAVLDLLETAIDVEDALQRLSSLLQVGELGAQAVLELQFRRLPLRERQKIAERCVELRERRAMLAASLGQID